MRAPLLLLLVLAAPAAWASDPDPSSLYVISTEGSTTVLKAGTPGTFVLSIHTSAGAHISEDAPMKLTLSGSGGVEPKKSSLSRTDAKSVPKPEGSADPRFEVPLAASSKGQGSVEAKLTFFVCTETLCSRQQKTLSLPVTVD
ncbi:MAG: hypothetical protein ACLQDQ_01900 [Myxococcaceae bacterium]